MLYCLVRSLLKATLAVIHPILFPKQYRLTYLQARMRSCLTPQEVIQIIHGQCRMSDEAWEHFLDCSECSSMLHALERVLHAQSE